MTTFYFSVKKFNVIFLIFIHIENNHITIKTISIMLNFLFFCAYQNLTLKLECPNSKQLRNPFNRLNYLLLHRNLICPHIFISLFHSGKFPNYSLGSIGDVLQEYRILFFTITFNIKSLVDLWLVYMDSTVFFISFSQR